jgi:2-dehydropantoate 2-reductase
MKVLIFGTGGVGSIYAYILETAGTEVTAVCRSNFSAVSSNGISLESALFGSVTARPQAVKSVEDATGPFDYILVCAKSFPGQAHLIKPAVGPNTAIVLCQNGIDIEREYADMYPSNTIISGVVYLPTTQVSPGHVKMGPLQLLHVGTFPATASASAKTQVQTFADTFAKGGGIIQVHDDVQAQRWIKLAVNVAWNPTCALSLCDDGNFLSSSDVAEKAVWDLMREVKTVADAAGYQGAITDEEIDQQLQRSRGRKETGGKEPSMLTDVRENRAMEVEAILGNTVRIAAAKGVEIPRLGLLYALIKGLNFAITRPDGWKAIA